MSPVRAGDRSMRGPLERFLREQLAKGGAAAADARRAASAPELLLSWFTAGLVAGHPGAINAWREICANRVGDCPLAEGALDWPSWLESATPGRTLRYVPRESAITGWRFWTVDDVARLCAPFITLPENHGAEFPFRHWARGRNTVDATGRWCHAAAPGSRGPTTHPSLSCACGIRAVQSLTVLDAYMSHHRREQWRGRVAIGQVAMWGWVSGPTYTGGDWSHTMAGQHAELVGALRIGAPARASAEGLSERYGVRVDVA